ncbi:CCDC180 [Bugula neritina]|uniref:CCDC180 n=1 Tax=Bugula neritina TaxID=10212 RepID=A0A7J7KF33_BUGNE|nr:CCDC180 [Bugula neritina]
MFTYRKFDINSFHRDVYEDEGQGQTFLTEVNLAGIAKTSSQNYEFLESFFISPEYFIKLKQSIRLNFITYMENWTDEAIQRAHSIIAANLMNSTLTELMMHNERVVRHCKGINQTLADLKLQFDKLLTEHQLTFDEFQKGVEAMEAVVLRGNKSSVLVEQQAAVQKAKEGFMNEIRVSLRTFRRSLDDTLQLMRESNAMFIKSFKLFSDGGNFCPEEIDVFRKNLDKYSHKVDDSEGGIMSELEV